MNAAHPSWMMRLRIRHLEVFVALVRTGSQSATAAALHVTQPALSKWLRELEENAGVALFERGRPMRLTRYGEVLLRYAQRVLGDSLRTADEMAALSSGSSGHVRVGVLHAVAPTLVPRAVANCRRGAPRVQITLHEDSQDNLLPRLQRHELDCLIGRLQVDFAQRGVLTEALYDEPVCAVVGRHHPLLARRRVSWQQAAAHPWILPLPGTPMRIRLASEFAAAGIPEPRDPIESVSLMINEGLLRITDMISVVSRQLAQHYEAAGTLAILPLPMRHALGPIGLVWIDERPTAAVTAFMDAVRAEAGRLHRPVDAPGVPATRRGGTMPGAGATPRRRRSVP